MDDFFSDVLPALATLIVAVSVIGAKKKKTTKTRGRKASYVPRSSHTGGRGVAKEIRSSARELSGKQHGGDHSHDRLDFDCYNANETYEEHNRRQLENFLKAGLITREEYRILQRRWSAK